MRKYSDNELLIRSVENNNITEIKRILVDNIFFLQGNKEEIEKATKYALHNSNFRFDVHDGSKITTLSEDQYAFSAENIKLLTNYSNERYDALVDLYPAVFGKNNDSLNTVVTKLPEDKKSSPGKMVAVAIAAVILVYIFYKILN